MIVRVGCSQKLLGHWSSASRFLGDVIVTNTSPSLDILPWQILSLELKRSGRMCGAGENLPLWDSNLRRDGQKLIISKLSQSLSTPKINCFVERFRKRRNNNARNRMGYKNAVQNWDRYKINNCSKDCAESTENYRDVDWSIIHLLRLFAF